MNNIGMFLAPPLLGAFIGYLTNYVAIKMLFRPLRPWYILGIRIPLTPGVIPSKRESLALNIGEMVGGHLLTSTDVSNALCGEEVGLQLESVINERVEDILQIDLGPLSSVVPERFRPYFEAGIKIFRWRALKSLHAHIDGEDFGSQVENVLSSSLNEFFAKKAGDILPQDSQEAFYQFLEKAIVQFLDGREVEEYVFSGVHGKMNDILSSRASCRDLLYDELVEGILDAIEFEAPILLSKFGHLLESSEMVEKVTDKIVSGIENFLLTLGPMAAFLQNMLEPDVVREKIKEYLQGKGASLGEWILETEVREKIAAMAREKASQFFNTPIADLLSGVPDEKIQGFIDWLAGQIVILIRKPETAQIITSFLQEKVKVHLSQSLQEVAGDFFGESALEHGRSWIAAEVTTLLRSNNVKRFIDTVIIDLVEKKMLSIPLGPLSAFLPKVVQESIGGYLLHQIRELLIKEVPLLVDSLNIRDIVAGKVNSLDLLRLEGLLLGIMQEQFKYINLFGALLGFIIGLLNVFIYGIYF